MLPRGTAISVSGTVTVDSNYLKSNIEFNEQYIDVEIKEFDFRSLKGLSGIPVNLASIKKLGSILDKLGITIRLTKELKEIARIGFDTEAGTLARVVTGPNLQINNADFFKSVLKGKYMYFNWKLSKELPEKEENGVRELVLRMDQSLRSNGLPIEGFEFIHSTKKMLEITREIEDEIKKSPRDVTLYVGFQNIDKLDKEINRYKELRSMGIKINAFGMNEASEIYSGAIDNWTKINESPENVENQWFLVVENPSPIAFVGWEISDELFAKC